MLSNLLQELALARDHNRKRVVLDEATLTENPVDRLSRMIKHSSNIHSGTRSLVVSMGKAWKSSPPIPRIERGVLIPVYTFLMASQRWPSTIGRWLGRNHI